MFEEKPTIAKTDAVLMVQTMRWFGPSDPVTLSDIRQSGAAEVVTALHEVPNGEIWSSEAIAERRAIVEAAGLRWTVVESLPVHEEIKTRGERWQALIDSYSVSLRNLSVQGIRVVTYNFMPLLDWTRTDLAWKLPDGARALRFEWEALAAYDIHVLRRPGAERDYAPALRAAADARFAAMTQGERDLLERTILAGLPGSEEHFTSRQFLDAIGTYAEIDAAVLRANHHAFVAAVAPVAASVGIQLVVHPDDPPFPIFGLPRVVSTSEDLMLLFAAVPDAANGLCFCTGSFGARRGNDLPAMVRQFGSRIGFLHLRSVALEGDSAFHEAAHLEGDAHMADVVREVHQLSLAERRRIPMRPDHGHQLLDDLYREVAPGYSLLGRMRGLAELRGLELGIAHAVART
jgi:mannonate dehydratase